MVSCSDAPTVLMAEEIPHSSPSLDHLDAAAVLACVESGWLAQGAGASRFADALRMQSDAADVVLASSGTSAITLALLALGVTTGNDVIVPTYVCASVLAAVRATGATPVLCDIGEHWILDATTVTRALTPRTRAIVAVSVFGLGWDVGSLTQFGIPIVDDRCQAFGLPRPAHALVPYSVCSFHATKCLTTGEGGAVLAWDGNAQASLQSVAASYKRSLAVFSDLQAALGLSQLMAWPTRQQRRHVIADAYLQALPSRLTARVAAAAQRGSVWFRMPLLLPHNADFDTVRERYAAAGIQVRRGVDALLHRALGRPDAQFPGATEAFRRTVSLPIWPSMTDAHVSRVVEASRDVLG